MRHGTLIGEDHYANLAHDDAERKRRYDERKVRLELGMAPLIRPAKLS